MKEKTVYTIMISHAIIAFIFVFVGITNLPTGIGVMLVGVVLAMLSFLYPIILTPSNSDKETKEKP